MTTCARCGEQAPEGARFCPACGAPIALGAAPTERRKIVTAVFADVVGFTALGEQVDPETVRWSMQRWFERMAVVVERHGGIVENYIGDAVMAVFGIPVTHEDDAVRAVRAAAEMRAEVAALSERLREERGVELAVRIGVNTGQAVTGVLSARGFFTVGDTINVAARLEQSARPGDVLLGRETLRLVGHAVVTEPLEPLAVKGKRKTVEAHRLVAIVPDGRGRPQRPAVPMVGRAEERQQVLDAFDEVVAEGGCRLLTVLGPAGVGKSRLASEAGEALRGHATVAEGRCLPYGDGLTWWPVTEALSGGRPLPAAAEGGNEAVAKATRMLGPAGEPVAPEEAFWVVRAALEALARARPLVLVIDDLQWADTTFLDFLEHIVATSRDAPLLLLALARPELLDRRPVWGAVSIVLEALVPPEAAKLLAAHVGRAVLDASTQARILETAEGNPLFVEELAAVVLDQGVPSRAGAPLALPPTIQALLASRLDRLAPVQRQVLEAAAIEGKEFSRARTRALVAARSRDVDAALDALVRTDLVRFVDAGEGTLRFRHQLVRDAAYEGMPKELRAELHERFADGLQARPWPLPVDELLGHHFECAVVLRRELGDDGAATRTLAERAAVSLRVASERAMRGHDPGAAIGMLERATALVAADAAARASLLPALGTALLEAGRMPEAAVVLDEAIADAADPGLEARARIEREFVQLETDTGAGTEGALRVADEALRELERDGDHRGQCRAWSLRAQVEWTVGHAARADAAWDRAADHARIAGDEDELFAILGWRATTAIWGPMPVDDGIRRCEAIRDGVRESPSAVAWTVNALAALHAMKGEFQLANELLREADETLRQLGTLRSSVSHIEALVRLLERAPQLAEAPLRADVEALTSASASDTLATTAAMLAQAVFTQGRLDEAGELCRLAEETAAADDIYTQAIWRGVQARVLVRTGRIDEAERLARGAVALAEPTDLLSTRGDAMLDLADVLWACRRRDESHRAARSALALFERKGNAVSAARARSMLDN